MPTTVSACCSARQGSMMQKERKKCGDYRYIYLIDTGMSHALGKMVFKEEFRNILCLPDKLIKKSRKEVWRNNENVYEQSFGRALTVRKPFDDV